MVLTAVGRVVSAKMQKSVVVEVARQVSHPLYMKYMTKHSRFIAHDEDNQCVVGDKVLLEHCRPLSKKKHHVVKEILDPYYVPTRKFDTLSLYKGEKYREKPATEEPTNKTA
eukprot:TRINITY_DN14383_c0_g1_i1.p1 TRINITY_DN14383_c0_g1~~TRINITY_DN14383_c0_g1_i1.p1  ORF type:complete len:112 (-),score=28.78 TRINITY_DN14383_c0_g1_i1:68-403(-)